MKNIYLLLVLFFYFSVPTFAQCSTEIGTLPSDTLFICENGMENIPHEDYVLNENDALVYVLHTENGLEEVIDTFSSNEIPWQELGAINWNTVYFVSAIGGLDEDMDGIPDDLNGECTVVSNAMPLVFAASVDFTLYFECDDHFFDYSLCSFVLSSYWHFSDQIDYDGGNVERTYDIYNTIDLDLSSVPLPIDFLHEIPHPDIAFFHITDNYACLDTSIIIDFHLYDCLTIFDGVAIINNMPSERQYICHGESSKISASCISTDFHSTTEYLLSTSPNYHDEDSVIATNPDEGIFSFADATGFENQELYIFGTVTHGFFENTDYTEEPTPIVFLKPIELAIQTLSCNESAGMATLEITPIGGLPEFDTEAFYTIGGTTETSLQFGESQTVEIPLSDAMEWELNLTISDGNDCEKVIEFEQICLVCPDIEIGTLPTDTLFVCENGMETFLHENYTLGEGDALVYVLHTENGLEEVIDTFSSNEIAWQELGAINWNTVYFVSAIGGLDEDMDGIPDDLNGECTVVSNAMPLVFAAPVDLVMYMDCFFDNEYYFDESLCSFVSTGTWLFENQISYQDGGLGRFYTITHNISSDTIIQQSPIYFSYTISDFTPTITQFHITDNFNCVDTTVSFDIFHCQGNPLIDGVTIITNMPSERQIICGTDTSEVEAGCIEADFMISSVKYLLSTSVQYDEDSVIATHPNSGNFSIEDAQGFENQELYIIGSITNSFWGNTGYSEEPTPIVFLKPIELDIHTLACNESTGIATLEITPIGGLPEFDTEAFYTIGGTTETSLQFGESQTVEIPLSDAMEWELNLTISDGNDCEEVIELKQTCIACPDIEIGTLPTDTLFVCENGMETFLHEDYALNEGEALVYLLHTENGLEEIIDTFPSNEIAWQELGAINWNTVYFVSAIGGVDEDMDGIPDDLNLSEECMIISNAMPMVFAAPMSFYYIYDCGSTFVDSLCQYVVDVDWRFTEENQYENGNLERQFLITSSLSQDTIPLVSDTRFEITVLDLSDILVVDFHIIDSYNCSDMTFSFDVYTDCIEPILSYDFFIISDMPSELRVVCHGGETTVRAGCIHNFTFPTPVYSLRTDSNYYSGTVLATSTNEGKFTSQDAQSYLNQELYIFGEVNNPFGSVEYTEKPTPIVFLKPFEVSANTLDCDADFGIAMLEISLSGGLPEFDADASYTIEGDIQASLQFGDTLVIQTLLSSTMEWGINLIVSDENDCQEIISTGEACVVPIEEPNTSNFYLQKIFPNPVNDLLHLQMEISQSQSFSLQLWDVNGSEVLRENRNFSVGLQELTLEVGQLPVGVYYLKIVGEEGVEVRKVMIE